MATIECGFEYNIKPGSGQSSFTDLVYSKDYEHFVKDGKIPFVHGFCPLDSGVGEPIDVRLTPEGKGLVYFRENYVVVNKDESLTADLAGMRDDFNSSHLHCDRYGTPRCPLSQK